MFTIRANGDRTSYGVKHYTLDTIDDLKQLEKKDITPGSTIFIINSSKYYMLNSKSQWVEIFPYHNSSNGGSDDEGPGSSPGNIYDGGSIDGSDPT